MTVPATAVAVTGGQVEVQDIPAAEPGRAPLVLLHEGLGSVSTWKSFPQRLAAATGRRVVVFSRLGYGWSDPAGLPRRPDYMHTEADVVLPDLLERIGVDRPVLIGHSDGASISLLHAGSGRPVTAIVALAPHVFVEECTLDGARAARREYTEGALRGRLARHHAAVDDAFYGWNDIWLSPGFRGWSIEDRLPGVGVPLLLVQCEDDPYGTLEQLDRTERAVAGPVERLVLESGGHTPQQAHPDAVLDRIARFLAYWG